LIANGKTNKEVGDELQLAEKTVKNYVSSILSKLGSGAQLRPRRTSRDTRRPPARSSRRPDGCHPAH
jgi:two-component system response regulator DevR